MKYFFLKSLKLKISKKLNIKFFNSFEVMISFIIFSNEIKKHNENLKKQNTKHKKEYQRDLDLQ